MRNIDGRASKQAAKPKRTAGKHLASVINELIRTPLSISKRQ